MDKREQNFISTANYQEEFIKAFMEHAREKRAVIELEIQKGGYINYPQLTETMYRTVEDKMRRELTTNSLNRKGIDQATFSKLVQKIKSDIQPIFFQSSNSR
jgi:replicative superfamily II helicase